MPQHWGVLGFRNGNFYDDGEEAERLQGDMSFSLETTIEELDEIVEEILGSKF